LKEILCHKSESSIPDEVIEFFSIYLILPAALGLGVYSASNRNEYQEKKKKKKKKSFWGVELGQGVMLSTSLPSASCNHTEHQT
jgi:hypothetical protein